MGAEGDIIKEVQQAVVALTIAAICQIPSYLIKSGILEEIDDLCLNGVECCSR